ncbi:putative protein-serine/threonine phosphatase [Helianthus annuus]|uniref:serine/threonine-protein phosphatase 7 long form homolog n=1 Tax=Helianthus annuus TaxID=4232 RepID=UPI001652C88B|nr:serine/threonine-protein phosphatase 7 long form homolog [Helianthus annuus]KAJ0510285.1 putative protein-serine/threonine phosphatase [Helianthus annuus]
MSYEMHPGPLSNDVLFLYNQHRALEVFKHPESYRLPINIKRSDRSFWKEVKQNPIGARVEVYIRVAGFGGILDSGYRYLDHALINALVERWRPETHTFHLPFGETTVTLQDVNVLWGLPIEGVPVCGADTPISFSDAASMCENLLGFRPTENQIQGKRISSVRILTEIKSGFSEHDATEEQCIIRARLIIFYLIGCTVFPDNANNWISLHFLHYLHDLRACSQISWGSSVLSSLYRNLCNATAPAAISVTGPVSILQVWAWERIRCVAPEPNNRFNYNAPLAARWKGSLSHADAPTHCLRSYRSQLQSIFEGMFIWRPYDAVMDRLPAICTSGSRSWRSACPLIYWETVEHHYPQRIMRQFGMVQRIPPSLPITVTEHARLHKLTRNGKTGWHWAVHHGQYIDAWNLRHQTVVDGERITSYSVADDYMAWFMRHTVLYLSNPSLPPVPMRGFQDDGARVQMLTDMMGVIHRSDNLEFTQGAAYRAMEMSNQQGYSQYPTHLAANPVDLTTYPRPQRLGRRRRRQRGGSNVEERVGSDWGRNFEQGGASGVQNQMNHANVQYQTNSEHVQTQNNQRCYTTQASHMLSFLPDNQSDYSYYAPNQSHEDQRACHANAPPNPLDWGMDLSLSNYQPPPN